MTATSCGWKREKIRSWIAGSLAASGDAVARLGWTAIDPLLFVSKIQNSMYTRDCRCSHPSCQSIRFTVCGPRQKSEGHDDRSERGMRGSSPVIDLRELHGRSTLALVIPQLMYRLHGDTVCLTIE